MDKVVHFEVPYDDEARAKRFYGSVFGWKIILLPEMSYTLVQTAKTNEKGMLQENGVINGGLIKREKTCVSPVLVINVANVAECIKKVEKGGGKRMIPVTRVGGMGLYARVKDTEGNIIGLWQDVGVGGEA